MDGINWQIPNSVVQIRKTRDRRTNQNFNSNTLPSIFPYKPKKIKILTDELLKVSNPTLQTEKMQTTEILTR